MYEILCHQVERRRIDQALTGIENRIFSRWHAMRWGYEFDPEAFAGTCDELLDHVAACARSDPALPGQQARAALRTAAECAAAVLDRRLWPNGDFEVGFPVLTARYGTTKLTSPETSYSMAEPRTPPVAEWVRAFALCLVSSGFAEPWRRNLVLKFDTAREIHASRSEPAAALAEMDALAGYLVDGDDPPLVVEPGRQARVRAALRLDAAGPLTPDQRLLRVLLDDDRSAFQQALADRLERYREDIGDDPAPRTLLPLPAIALAHLAVLAHGWRLDVRSGYLPEGLLPEPPATDPAGSTGMPRDPDEHLTGTQQRVLRLMPLNPGPQISTPALAALTGLPAAEAFATVEALAGMRLVEEGEPYGWWRPRDPARTFGTAEAGERDDALARLLEHYRASAADADRRLHPTSRDRERMFTGRADALVWLDIESPTLIAAARTAADTGRPGITRHIALALGEYLNLRHRTADALEVSTLALRAARQSGDRHAEADALNGLGVALRRLRRFEEAVTAHTDAAAVHRQDDDRPGEARTLNNLGSALLMLRRYEEAVTAYTDAAAIYRETAQRRGEGLALNNLGSALRDAGRFEEAISALTEAERILSEAGDRRREALAVNNLGSVLKKTGRPDEAATAHARAAELFRRAGDRHGEATAWHGLGLARHAAGRPDEAAAAIEKAAAAYRDAGDHHWHRRALDLLDQIRARRHGGG
ncbi:tetratricopeptide repeat protein [Actinomadura sp. NAK00032]|uniref:Imm49 family immunity protein n=1 Tax=Actinomadura sp. NAK00032 TaxID=2742128 RepID=UPI0015928F81|nr:Imm49 family immunity protein [Actinomadura sp. NAK00032]QKW36847.1 tetratricopeptide repeat protein [Actinomadura sp. NAK00032]